MAIQYPRRRNLSFARSLGLTYLAILIAVAILGVGVAAVGAVWSQSMQREKEKELLHIGNQFRRAIGLYYNRTPGTVKRYPEKLDELLIDSRHLTIQRYLRRIYVDPMTGSAEWGLVRAPEGGIMGVYSLSEATPIKVGNFGKDNEQFANTARYSNWQFIYTPPFVAALQTQPTASRNSP